MKYRAKITLNCILCKDVTVPCIVEGRIYSEYELDEYESLLYSLNRFKSINIIGENDTILKFSINPNDEDYYKNIFEEICDK